VLRKLIAKLQAFSQCNQEMPMLRFYSSIYADDKSTDPLSHCKSKTAVIAWLDSAGPGSRGAGTYWPNFG
jgi:hypothetical protein